jgi:large subunit ribosomal protein L21
MTKTAVIATGGKQYLVREDDVITIEKLGLYKEGESVTFDEVLLVDDGATSKLGAPFINGATVVAEVVENGRAAKVLVQRYRQKSRSFKRNGHRQSYTKVKITSIA